MIIDVTNGSAFANARDSSNIIIVTTCFHHWYRRVAGSRKNKLFRSKGRRRDRESNFEAADNLPYVPVEGSSSHLAVSEHQKNLGIWRGTVDERKREGTKKADASETEASSGRRGNGALEGEEESGWLQRCGYVSVPEWFFWFLVGSRPTGGLTDTGNRARSPSFFQYFLPWRVSWPVVGVRMRLARLGWETSKGLVGWPEGKEAGGGPHAGVKVPGKESYCGITRLLRSADSPEEIIAATHVSDYGYRARPSCARIDSQDTQSAAGIVAKARKARINCRAEMDFRRSRRRFFCIDDCLPSTRSRLAVVIGDWFQRQTDISALAMNSGCEEKFR